VFRTIDVASETIYQSELFVTGIGRIFLRQTVSTLLADQFWPVAVTLGDFDSRAQPLTRQQSTWLVHPLTQHDCPQWVRNVSSASNALGLSRQ